MRMRTIWNAGAVGGLVAVAVVLLPCGPARAHEPIFGLGPHTIYQGGVGITAGYDLTLRHGDDRVHASRLGLTYGVHEDVSLSLALPYVVLEGDADAHGFGDAVGQVKWRFWKDLAPRVIDSAALVLALQAPTGQAETSAGNTGYLLGLTAAREHLRYYVFGTLRYASFTLGLEGKPGDVFLYDLAVGVRPWIPEYEDPDLVLLVELDGAIMRPSRSDEHEAPSGTTGTLSCPTTDDPRIGSACAAHSAGATAVPGSGADGTSYTLSVAPEALLSWRNWMLKVGVQIPLWQRLDGVREQTVRLRTDLVAQF